MARQKTIRLRALPERPAGPTPQGGAAVIDVPFIDLSAPPRAAAAPPRRRRKKKAGAASFMAMSALAAAIVVLAVAALFAGIAAGSPV